MTRGAAPWLGTSFLLLATHAGCDNVPDSASFWLGGGGAGVATGSTVTGPSTAAGTTTVTGTSTSTGTGGGCSLENDVDPCTTNAMCCGFTGSGVPGDDSTCLTNDDRCHAVCHTASDCQSGCCVALTGVSYGACMSTAEATQDDVTCM